jgi:hypothetical protein
MAERLLVFGGSRQPLVVDLNCLAALRQQDSCRAFHQVRTKINRTSKVRQTSPMSIAKGDTLFGWMDPRTTSEFLEGDDLNFLLADKPGVECKASLAYSAATALIPSVRKYATIFAWSNAAKSATHSLTTERAST